MLVSSTSCCCYECLPSLQSSVPHCRSWGSDHFNSQQVLREPQNFKARKDPRDTPNSFPSPTLKDREG